MAAQHLDLMQTQLLNTLKTGTLKTLQACLTQRPLAVAAVVLARKVGQFFTELNMSAHMQLTLYHKQTDITVAKPRDSTLLISKSAIVHKPELVPPTSHHHFPIKILCVLLISPIVTTYLQI